MQLRGDEVKKIETAHVKTLFPDEHLFPAVNASVTMIRHLTNQICEI